MLITCCSVYFPAVTSTNRLLTAPSPGSRHQQAVFSLRPPPSSGFDPDEALGSCQGQALWLQQVPPVPGPSPWVEMPQVQVLGGRGETPEGSPGAMSPPRRRAGPPRGWGGGGRSRVLPHREAFGCPPQGAEAPHPPRPSLTGFTGEAALTSRSAALKSSSPLQPRSRSACNTRGRSAPHHPRPPPRSGVGGCPPPHRYPSVVAAELPLVPVPDVQPVAPYEDVVREEAGTSQERAARGHVSRRHRAGAVPGAGPVAKRFRRTGGGGPLPAAPA